MRQLFIVVIVAMAGVAHANHMPANNYSCKSIVTFIVDGKYGPVDTQEQIIGYVLTPNTHYIYKNVGLAQFVHKFKSHTLYMAADSGISSYDYEPGIDYSTVGYYYLSSSISDPQFNIKLESGFEVPDVELPKNFVIRLDYVEIDEHLGALPRLVCGFREQVDPEIIL